MIFKGRGKQRISLRQAFGQDSEAKEEVKARPTHTSREEWRDSISSLVDLEDRRVVSKAEADSKQEEAECMPALSPTTPTVSLFSSAATPLLSRQDAVALRNVGCLDFAGMHEEGTMPGQAGKGLRKMRSVDALELALKRMERLQQQTTVSKAPSRLHSSIPETFSSESLTNEDFANATTTTTLIASEAHSEAVSSMVEPIRRSGTPRLVITSPTGIRSPQPLVLEGQEFEPRSISPEAVRIIRPVASRRSGWRLSAVVAKPEDNNTKKEEGHSQRGRRSKSLLDETKIPSSIPKRSSSKKKNRMTRSRDGSADQEESKLPVPTKTAKKRLSRSCTNLRENALSQIGDIAGSAGKLSGSEQIRALRRDVMKRKGGAHPQHQGIYADESKQQRTTTIPSNYPSDEDDPFNDFVAISKTSTSSNLQEVLHIDRTGMSPIPFEHSQRRPLSTSQQFNVQLPASSTAIQGKTLSRKKSGVGIACLVEKENSRASSTSSIRSDENSKSNPLLDSPTAHVVKKRSSRTRLGQH